MLHQMAPQYREVSPSQKRSLLEAFIATTGYVRKYARWLLNHADEVQQTHGRSQLRRYGPDVQHVLFLAWHAANRICAKRLIPFLPTLREALERHEHLHISEECRRQLLAMSAATADRLLRSQSTLGQMLHLGLISYISSNSQLLVPKLSQFFRYRVDRLTRAGGQDDFRTCLGETARSRQPDT